MTNSSPEGAGTARLLAAFADAVRSSPHNLLSRRALGELESRHIAESVAFAQTLPHGATVLDLGTGGGFPGMIIAIVRPDLAMTLLDATAKKTQFLADFAEEHGVSVHVLTGRAEELHRVHAGEFDHVVARAVAPLDRLVAWSVPFLRPGGTLRAIKGERWKEELEEALPTIRRHGCQVASVPGHGAGASGADSDLSGEAMPRVVIIRAPG